jgi:hypothetical protein
VFFASVVDKVQMTEIYSQPESANSLAYRLIFDQFQRFLGQTAERYGLVIFDKITDASFKSKGYENLLIRQHLRHMEQETCFAQIQSIVEGLLFIPSAENNFIQLADLCAYNVFRQFKEQGRGWDNPDNTVWPMYKYFRRIIGQFYVRKDGLLNGWGIQKYPDHAKLGLPKVPWYLKEDQDLGWDIRNEGSKTQK